MHRLNRAQRVVLVVGWGLVLLALARYVVADLDQPGPADWFNYAPGTLGSADGDDPSVGPLLVWLVATALWVAGSLLLLRTHPDDRADP